MKSRKNKENILEVKNLEVSFGNEKIIENISFQVKKEDFFIILGPNGAGKSTLLKAVLGLIPYKGNVKWLNHGKVAYLPDRMGKEKFKETPLNVIEFFKMKEKSLKKIKEVLNNVGLDESILYKNPGDLSSGQFQRMLIAWSLISNPEVMVLDEPSTGIDIGGGETIYSLLDKLRKEKGITIIIVTHELEIIYRYATNVLCINKGKHTCVGSPKEVLTPEALEAIYGTKIKFYEHKH